MSDGQIGLLLAAPAIVAVAVALYRQGAMGRGPLVTAIVVAVGLIAFLFAGLVGTAN